MSARDEIQSFRLLKQKIVETMQRSYPGIPDKIENWKGQEIIDFQEELQSGVKENLSEKWFYLHMKSESEKLPRIDTLNLLSRFTGYADWNDFKYQSKGKTKKRVHPDQTNRLFYLLPVLFLGLIGTVFLIIKLSTFREYQFCFVNQLTQKPVPGKQIDVVILWENESPEYTSCDSAGCFRIRTNKTSIRFVVNAPYFRKDTINFRLGSTDRIRTVSLRANDYAMMIHYLANAKVVDWQARRTQLDMIFSDNAMIYQIQLDDNLGMDVFNKWEFINKITLPAEGLKNLEIIETTFSGEQVSALWFRQMGTDNE
ncbi:hypothetical protein ACFLTU_01675 [Bacteroidota bacterium]